MGLIDLLQIPQGELELFIRTVEVSSYIPGRIRLYSRSLVGNTALNQQICRYLRSFRELSKVETNIMTGSILIQYTPQLLHTNAELARVEKYIKNHTKRRL